MGFFNRDVNTGAAGPATPDDELVRVVNDLSQAVYDGMREFPLSRDTLELLQVGLPYMTQQELSTEAILAGQTAARLGYLSRAAECAMFSSGQELDEELLETLEARMQDGDAQGDGWMDAMADVAAEMAANEPIEATAMDGGPSWRLPGADGDIRRTLRNHHVRSMSQHRSEATSDDLKRTWKYGYFLRACEECFEEE